MAKRRPRVVLLVDDAKLLATYRKALHLAGFDVVAANDTLPIEKQDEPIPASLELEEDDDAAAPASRGRKRSYRFH